MTFSFSPSSHETLNIFKATSKVFEQPISWHDDYTTRLVFKIRPYPLLSLSLFHVWSGKQRSVSIEPHSQAFILVNIGQKHPSFDEILPFL